VASATCGVGRLFPDALAVIESDARLHTAVGRVRRMVMVIRRSAQVIPFDRRGTAGAA
jgi:hypothetical protein